MTRLNLPRGLRSNQKERSESPIVSKKAAISSEVKKTLDLLPQLVWLTKSGIGYCNCYLKDYLGLDSHDISDYEWLKALHPEDAEHFYNLWSESQKNGNSFEKECRIKDVDGEYYWFLLIAKSHIYKNKHYDWTITCTNIHERATYLREALDTLKANTEMLDVSLDCIKIISPSGKVTHMNKSGCVALLGQENVKKFGMDWLSLLPTEVRPQGRKAIKQTYLGMNSRFAGKSITNGHTMYWDNILTPVLDEDGETSRILCVSRDITLQKMAEEKLKISSGYDALTHLMNRKSFIQKFKNALGLAKKNKRKFALFIIDLDYFKHVNDILGHAAGDHLLKALSKRISDCLPLGTYFARLGGDEFAVISNQISENEEIEALAKLILKQIDQPIKYKGTMLNIGMSIGYSVYPDHAQDLSNLLKCADTALNDLKTQGRGGFRSYKPEMLQEIKLKGQQLITARQIIREDRIEPFYQAKVQLDTRQLVGFEALLRWKDDEMNIHYPVTIVEAFNDYDLASKISEIIQTKIFKDISTWLSRGLKVVPISINASPVEFMRDDYAEHLLSRMNKYNIPAELIEVEITEHILSDRGSHYVIRALKKLHDAGLRIALDDFGTGYSSLTHLSDYPVDCLKIDYNFVNRLNEEKAINAIVEGITRLGPILSLDIIAEGIETDQQLECLKSLGCNFGQGFLFSQAICAESATRLLTENYF